jgi:hypothetical protein
VESPAFDATFDEVSGGGGGDGDGDENDSPDSDDGAAYAGVAARGLAGTFWRDDARTGGCVTVSERVFLRVGGRELGDAMVGSSSSSALSAEVLLPFPLLRGIM